MLRPAPSSPLCALMLACGFEGGDRGAFYDWVRSEVEAHPEHGLSGGEAMAFALGGGGLLLEFAIDVSRREREGNDAVTTDALRRHSESLLRNGEPLPERLAAWLADYLAGRIAPKRATKRSRPTAGRDSAIAVVVWRLHEISKGAPGHTLTPTRNSRLRSAADGESSCCDVVGYALNLTYKTIENVWRTSWVRDFTKP